MTSEIDILLSNDNIKCNTKCQQPQTSKKGNLIQFCKYIANNLFCNICWFIDSVNRERVLFIFCALLYSISFYHMQGFAAGSKWGVKKPSTKTRKTWEIPDLNYSSKMVAKQQLLLQIDDLREPKSLVLIASGNTFVTLKQPFHVVKCHSSNQIFKWILVLVLTSFKWASISIQACEINMSQW